MASKRLSKLKSSELDPSEKGLSDDDELNLNGKLLMATEDDIKNWERGHKGGFNDSIDNESLHSTSGEESGEDSDENHQKVQLPPNSISRGFSITAMQRRTVKINFDIVDTRITGGRNKYVLYLLVVTQTPGLDSDRATIERRYSDFYKLHKELKKLFPTFIQDIEFPEKKVRGNLDSSLINTRCRLLKQFVQKIYEKEEIRSSDTFKKFFYISSLQQGCKYICGGQFKDALNFLLNGLHLQQKLALDSSKEVIVTLCNIVECYMSLENYDEVTKYSNAALELIGDSTSDIYLLPLLQTLKDAYAILGKNTNETEKRIREIVALNYVEVDHLPSLRELAAKRFAYVKK